MFSSRWLGGLTALVLLAETAVLLPAPAALLLVAAVGWLALPGVALLRGWTSAVGTAAGAAWLIGPLLGLAFSGVGMLALWSAGLQNWLTVLLAPVLPYTVAWCGRRGGLAVRWPSFGRRDAVAVACALAVVPLITWAPYGHVREPMADGDAYRAYFTADFAWAMTVTAELAKGEVPPENPLLSGGHRLHYYWMAHFLSGVTYRNLRAFGVSAEQVILINGLLFGSFFVLCVYALTRSAGASPAFAALFVAVGFCANSYEGVNRLWVLWQAGAPLSTVKEYNIDAVTRWFYQAMPVDGLQRLLLYQPHHLLGYVAALSALWLIALAEDVTQTAVALAAGLLLALAFLYSTFTAIILGAAVGLLYGLRLVALHAWTATLRCAVLGGGTALAGALMTRVLVYTDPRAGSLMSFGVNPIATTLWPWMLLLSFGPLLILGGAGMLRLPWVRREGAAPAVLALTAFAFYFLVDVEDMGGVWVGWRSGHQILIAFVVAAAAAATALWRRRVARLPLGVAILVLCVPAVPTVAIDVFNAQDVWNRTQGPHFPWTLVITPAEREALEWLKRSTPSDAVVQFEPTVRGNKHWVYLPAFAERRMAAGESGAMIPFDKYEQASDTVLKGIFLAPSARAAHEMAVALDIDYLFVGRDERRSYGNVVVDIKRHPELFPPAFANDAVSIFEVRR